MLESWRERGATLTSPVLAVVGAFLLQQVVARNVADGDTIRIDVGADSEPLDGSTDYIVSLLCDSGDIALSWTTQRAAVVRNSKLNGVWGTNESISESLHSSVSNRFTLDFKMTPAKWEITLDGLRKSALDYNHRARCAVTRATVTSNLKAWISILETPATIARPDSDGQVTAIIVASIIAIASVFICVVLWLLRRKLIQSGGSLLLPDEGNEELRDWLYRDEDEIVGPFTGSEMRAFLETGRIDGNTMVKLVWQPDYEPVEAMFPHGNEFRSRPTFTREEVNTDWHRHSRLAQPQGVPLPAMDWYYQAPTGKMGPFETGKMRHWYMENFFDESVLIRLGDKDGEFAPIRAYYPNPESAFAEIPIRPARPSTGSSSSSQGRSSRVLRDLLQDHSHERVWYVKRSDGQVLGPYDNGKMRAFLITKTIDEFTLVRTDNAMGTFRKVQEYFPDLRDAFVSRPQQPAMCSALTGAAGVDHWPAKDEMEDEIEVDFPAMDDDAMGPRLTGQGIGDMPDIVRLASRVSVARYQSIGGMPALPGQDAPRRVVIIDPDAGLDEPLEVSPEQEAAIVRIQSLARGNAVRKDFKSKLESGKGVAGWRMAKAKAGMAKAKPKAKRRKRDSQRSVDDSPAGVASSHLRSAGVASSPLVASDV